MAERLVTLGVPCAHAQRKVSRVAQPGGLLGRTPRAACSISLLSCYLLLSLFAPCPSTFSSMRLGVFSADFRGTFGIRMARRLPLFSLLRVGVLRAFVLLLSFCPAARLSLPKPCPSSRLLLLGFLFGHAIRIPGLLQALLLLSVTPERGGAPSVPDPRWGATGHRVLHAGAPCPRSATTLSG